MLTCIRILLWVECNLLAFSHIMWKTGEALRKFQMVETTKNCCISVVAGIKVGESCETAKPHRREPSVRLQSITSNGSKPRRAQCTVLWARRRGIHQSRIQTWKNADRSTDRNQQQEPPSQHCCNGCRGRVSMAAEDAMKLLPEESRLWSWKDSEPKQQMLQLQQKHKPES